MVETFRIGNKTRKLQTRKDLSFSMTERGFADYLLELQMSRDELLNPNNLILDLGSGVDQNLSKACRKKHGAKVVSFDPSLSISKKKFTILSFNIELR